MEIKKSRIKRIVIDWKILGTKTKQQLKVSLNHINKIYKSRENPLPYFFALPLNWTLTVYKLLWVLFSSLKT